MPSANDSSDFVLAPRVMIRNRAGQVLVIRRSGNSVYWPGEWEFPGGKPDAGETWSDSLLREAREETGLTVTLTRFVGAAGFDLPARAGKPARRLVLLLFEASPVDEDGIVASNEHSESRWVEDAELQTLGLTEPIRRALGF
jgi:mutator protein MutT